MQTSVSQEGPARAIARKDDGQQSLTFTLTHARTTDPVTSQLAAARATEFVGNHCARILDCLKKYGPQSKDEIAARCGLSGVATARRLPDLQAKGLAMPTQATCESMAGRAERIWVAVE